VEFLLLLFVAWIILKAFEDQKVSDRRSEDANQEHLLGQFRSMERELQRQREGRIY
jgi:hypothetical protein